MLEEMFKLENGPVIASRKDGDTILQLLWEDDGTISLYRFRDEYDYDVLEEDLTPFDAFEIVSYLF